jgi:hypothetical protein
MTILSQFVLPGTVLDEESRRRYGFHVEPILREFSGEVKAMQIREEMVMADGFFQER